MKKKVLWEEFRRPEFEQAVKENAIVIFALGSTEQNGVHLPVNADLSPVFEIAKRAAEAVDDFQVLVLPAMWLGYSQEHMSYSGTITLKYHTFVEVISQVAASVYAHGFKKIFFLNGHGGNAGAVRSMRTKLAYEDNFPPSVSIDEWRLPTFMEHPVTGDGHAGSGMTSMHLYLQPDLVDKDSMVWSEGVFGDPSNATREEGERLIKGAVNDLVKMLRDYHDDKIDDGWGCSGEPFVGRKSAHKELDTTWMDS